MPDFFDWFVPPAVRGDARLSFRVRGVVKALLAITLVVAVLLGAFLLVREQPSAIELRLFAAATAMPVLAALSIRFTGRIAAILILTNLAGIFCVAAWAWASGGIQSVAAPWLLALLAALGAFGNIRVLLIAFVADVAVLAALYLAGVTHRLPPSVVPAGEAASLTLLSLLSSVFVVALAAVLVVRERRRVNALLRESEARFERAIDASGVILWDADSLTGEVYLGEAWSALVDAPPGPTRVTLQQLVALVPAEERKVLFDAAAAVLKGERADYAVEHRVRGRGGEWRWILSRGKVTQRDPASGRALRMSGTNVDITERKRLEGELLQRTRHLNLILDAIPGVVAHVGQDERYTFVNRGFLEAFGRTADQVIGRSAREVLGDALYESTLRYSDRVRRGESAQFERQQTLPDGTLRSYAVRYMPDIDEQGEVRGLISLTLDVTERKRNEEALRQLNEELDQRIAERTAALRESEERLRRLIDLLPGPVFVKDRGGRYLICNRANAELLGTAPEETLGRNAVESGMRPENAALVDAADAEARRTGLPQVIAEFAMTDRQGRRRVFLNARIPFAYSAEHPDAILGAATEITALKDAEDEVRRLNAELELRVAARTSELSAALAELEAFSYTVSHDLRAPARAVAGFSQMLLEDYGHQFEPGAHALLGRVSAAGRTMGEMIDGLLNLARIARAEIHRCPVDLSGLAADIWTEVTMAERDRRVKFELQPGLAADADPILLRTVLQNLLANAFKYTRHAADARVAVGRAERDGETLFFVRDNGAGFDLQYAAKLFGAFQRMHSASEFEGSGIGLATVKRIVERHGGRVWAESRPGEGATFYFTLESQGAAA